MIRIRNYLSIIGLLILFSFLSACSIDININDYFDKNAPFNLAITKTDKSTGFSSTSNFEISVNTDKFKKIIQWGNENVDGWKWAPASYQLSICLGQGDFRLLSNLGSEGVVIGFTDKVGKARQYSKTIKKGSLDFLTREVQSPKG